MEGVGSWMTVAQHMLGSLSDNDNAICIVTRVVGSTQTHNDDLDERGKLYQCFD